MHVTYSNYNYHKIEIGGAVQIHDLDINQWSVIKITQVITHQRNWRMHSDNRFIMIRVILIIDLDYPQRTRNILFK